MKKLVVLIAVLLVICALFGGCASSSNGLGRDQIASAQTIVTQYLKSRAVAISSAVYVGHIEVNGSTFTETLSYVDKKGGEPELRSEEVTIIDDQAIENNLYVFHIGINSKDNILMAADIVSKSVYCLYTDVDGKEAYVKVSPVLDQEYMDSKITLPEDTLLPPTVPSATAENTAEAAE